MSTQKPAGQTAQGCQVQTPADAAEAKMRKELMSHRPPVNYKTGRADGKGSMPPLWATIRRTGNCCIGPVLDTNPLTRPTATLWQHYIGEQKFGVFNPVVSHNHLRKAGDLKCPKCKEEGVLEGNGLRQGTRCVLTTDGQIKVFSYGITHKKCSAHNGKDYTFSTWDSDFLSLNFQPALFDVLPWVWLSGNTCVERALADDIVRQRSLGVSFEQIAMLRNEHVASRVVRTLKVYCEYQVARRQRLQAMQQLLGANPADTKTDSTSPAAAEGAPPPACTTAAANLAATAGSLPASNTAAVSPAQAAASSQATSGSNRAGSAKAVSAKPAAAAAAAANGARNTSRKQQTEQHLQSSQQLTRFLGPVQKVFSAVCASLSPTKQQQPEPQQHQPGPQQQQPAPQQQEQQPKEQLLDECREAAGAAAVPNSLAQQKPPGEKLRGPWDPEGFGLRKLDAKFAARVFTETSDARRQLQAEMMSREKADGHMSLDHVHETAKRMVGNYEGMLIAMGASGVVLGYWNVYSTSLNDVEQQLKELNKRQLQLHGQGISYVTVDNPHTVEALLQRVLPGITVKMDPGHVLFSRLGKLLDKNHALYGSAVKALACSFFDFNAKDLMATCEVIRRSNSKFRFASDAGMVKELPLSTWKRTVRRVYLQPEKQLERLQAWYKEYIGNKNAFVDTTIEGKPRRLVRGGEEGLQKFELVLNSQLTLVRKGMLSDPEGVDMYVEVGRTKQGLTTWRSTRGSSKNEAANLVIERSLHTTGRMNEITALGIVSDRFARFNYDVKLSLLKAQLKLTGQPSVIQHYDHCMDFMTQLRVNKLCSQLGLEMPFPLLNPAELQDPEQSDTAADADLTAAGAVGQQLVANASAAAAVDQQPAAGVSATEASKQQPAAADGAEPVLDLDDEEPELLPADWDEELLENRGCDSDDDWDAADDTVAGWQAQQTTDVNSGDTTGAAAQAATGPAVLTATGTPGSTAVGLVIAEGATKPKPNSPARCSAQVPAVISPSKRQQRTAAAGVALNVVRELCNNQALDSDEEFDGSSCRDQKRRRTSGPAASGDLSLQPETDAAMVDVDAVAKTPALTIKQQRQLPTWLADSIATRLEGREPISPVSGEDEEQLFLELLPSFISGNVSSPLRVAAASINFTAFAVKWNELAQGSSTAASTPSSTTSSSRITSTP